MLREIEPRKLLTNARHSTNHSKLLVVFMKTITPPPSTGIIEWTALASKSVLNCQPHGDHAMHQAVPCAKCKRHMQSEQRWHNYLGEFQQNQLAHYSIASRSQIKLKLRKRGLLPPIQWSTHPVSMYSRRLRHQRKAEMARLAERERQMQAQIVEIARLTIAAPVNVG